MARRNPEWYSIIYNYVNQYYAEQSKYPSVRDITAGTGISVSTVHRCLTDTMKEIQYSYEQNVSEMLFKTAVELSKINNVLADSFRIPRSYLEGLTAQTAHEVAENNGIIHLEQYVNGGDHHAEADH